jgi:hypothetical protein
MEIAFGERAMVISARCGLLTAMDAGRRSTSALPWWEQTWVWERFEKSERLVDTSEDLREDNETHGRIDRAHRSMRFGLACLRHQDPEAEDRSFGSWPYLARLARKEFRFGGRQP